MFLVMYGGERGYGVMWYLGDFVFFVFVSIVFFLVFSNEYGYYLFVGLSLDGLLFGVGWMFLLFVVFWWWLFMVLEFCYDWVF